MPNDKNLKRLNALLEAFDGGAVQPDELMKAIDAVMAVLDKSSNDLLEALKETKKVTDKDIKDALNKIEQAKNDLVAYANSLDGQGKQSINALRKELLTAIEKVSDSIPVLPDEVDLTDIYASLQGYRGELDNLSQLILGENIRNALESLNGDERLDISAIKGLDDYEEISRLARQKGGTAGAGVRFLRYMADVNVEGVTDGQVLTYDASTSKWVATTSAGGVTTFTDLTDTPASYSGQAGKAVTVNGTEDGLEFTPLSGGGDMLASVYDPANGAAQVAFASELHDPVTVTDSTEIDFTLTGQDITASLKAGSIDESKLDASVNASLDLADSASQPGHTHSISDVTSLQTTLDGKMDDAVVVSGSLTASNNTYYNNVASATYTDPSPTEGKGFVVFVRNGTATVGGTGYSTAGTIVNRIYHSGAWSNYVYQVSSTFASTSHTHSLANITDVTASASEVNILDGATLSTTELNYVDGVTSAIQTQLDGKSSTSHTHTLSAITDVTASAAEVNVLDGIPATLTATELGYMDGVTSSVQTQLDGKLTKATNFLIKSITIESPTSSEDITMFFTDDAITVTQLNAVCVGSTPSVTWTIRHSTDRSATGNEVVTSGTTTTSTTTGSEVTSFNDATIPAGSWVWLETTATSGTVTNINISAEYTVD